MDAFEVASVGVSAREENRRKNADAILRERTNLSITATILAAGRPMPKLLVLEFTTTHECELDAVGAKLAESPTDAALLLDASDTENVTWATLIDLDTGCTYDTNWKVTGFSLADSNGQVRVPTHISVARRASIVRKQDGRLRIAHEAPGTEVAIVDIDAIREALKTGTAISLSEEEQRYLKIDYYDLWLSIQPKVLTRRKCDGGAETPVALLSRAVASQTEFLDLIAKFESATGIAIDIAPLGPWLAKLRDFEERLIGESTVAVIEDVA